MEIISKMILKLFDFQTAAIVKTEDSNCSYSPGSVSEEKARTTIPF
ncbi:hypothetical protein [Thermococcus thermotolerans]|nr:hypothetical protein [Thermococcus thermotolerans]